MSIERTLAALLVLASPVAAQTSSDPFPEPIGAGRQPIVVNYVEFAQVPDAGRDAPRMTLLIDEPGTRRMFVNDMRGPLFSVSYDGKTVRRYVDINEAGWGYAVQAQGNERGFYSFAFHPQFAQVGTPGYGKFYTWGDVSDTVPPPDFRPGPQGRNSHDTVLLEWTARNPSAPAYDGGPPRQLIRIEQPYPNHNGGQLAFNPTAAPGSPDYGMLYVGVADGGSGGDPMNQAQNLGSIFGKILRIDPLGSNSANGKYGIPADNPFVSRQGALGEIYSYGHRNPQRFGWDPQNGNLFEAEIGQNTVEELNLIKKGANYGWNVWEASFTYGGRGVGTANPRGDPSMTFPVAEYDQSDPLLQPLSAATGVAVYRANRITQIANMVLWGDNPSGEVFAISADNIPNGGQAPIRRVLLNDNGTPKTLLQLIQAKNAAQGRGPAQRADLRFGTGPEGRVFLLNKQDGVVRELVSGM
jgi:Glucose / Sorbosone dehydrogenase